MSFEMGLLVSGLFGFSLGAYVSHVWCRYKPKHRSRSARLRSQHRLTADVRAYIYQRDRYTCQICGSEGGVGRGGLSVDHKTPITRGGDTWKWNGKLAEANLQTACRKCNSSKGNRLIG